MIRCTIELLPGGDETRRRTIGLVEIANIATNPANFGTYAVVLKKCPPFRGALRQAWRKGQIASDDENGYVRRAVAGEDDETIVTQIEGHHRTRRGVYDLLYRALRACGLEERNPR